MQMYYMHFIKNMIYLIILSMLLMEKICLSIVSQPLKKLIEELRKTKNKKDILEDEFDELNSSDADYYNFGKNSHFELEVSPISTKMHMRF